MIQFMSLEDFGTFGAIMGLLNIFWVVLTGFVLFLNKEISNNISSLSKVKSLYLSSRKILTLLWIWVAILFSLFSPLFTSFLAISVIGYFFLSAWVLLLSFPSASIQATLRWLKKFEFLAFLQVITPFLKLLIWIGLVYFGYNIYGAIGGILLSGLLGIALSAVYLKKLLAEYNVQGSTQELLQDFRRQKQEILHFFLSALFFAILMNMDVLLAKNIFSSQDAGIYTGISVLWKFLIFLLLTTETVYYGQILEFSREKLPVHLLRNALAIFSIIGVWAILFNLLFGKFVIGVLKWEFVEYYHIYMISLVYYASIGYISFSSKILIAWGKNFYNIFFGIFLAMCIAAIYTFGSDSLLDFIEILSIFWVFWALFFSFSLYREWRK
jgi:O-antigen/teichoic acid export membrane protein